MKIKAKTVELEAILLLESTEVDDPTWDKHVDELQDFLGDQDWDGDDVGIYVHLANHTLCGVPGQWVTKDPAGAFNIVDRETFSALYEEVQ